MKFKKNSVLFGFLVVFCISLLSGCQSKSYTQKDLEKMGVKRESEKVIKENLEILEETGKNEESKYSDEYDIFYKDEFLKMKGTNPVGLFFYKEWSEKSMEIEKEILANKEILKNKIKIFKVMIDNEPELRDFYGVIEDGTVVILDETGKEKYNGVPEKFDKLIEELNNISIK